MVTRRVVPASRRLRGATLIEVLIAMVIIAFGLLGIAGLQVRLQTAEMEAYQRSQALLLLADLKGRMEANRLQVSQYAAQAPTATPAGVGADCSKLPVPIGVGGGLTRAQQDMADWCNALQGASETTGGGVTKLGAMVGGRGCVEDLGTSPTGDRSLRITVVWQASTPLAAPPEACGAGSYNGVAGSACQGDLCRRAVSTVVRIAKLN